MRYKLIVIRKDSPARWYFCAEACSQRGIKQLSPEVSQALQKRMVMEDGFVDDTGALHIDLSQYNAYITGLLDAYSKDRMIFLKFAERFRKVGSKWINNMQSISATHLESCSDAKLKSYFKIFVDGYYSFTPALFIVFPVERLQETNYSKLIGDLASRTSGRPENMELRSELRQKLEFSVDRTEAEARNLTVDNIVLEILSQKRCYDYFVSGDAQKIEELKKSFPKVASMIENAVEEYGWIKQWGYPPFYSAATIADYITEIKSKLSKTTKEQVLEKERAIVEGRRRFRKTINALPISNDEVILLETINTYEFFRTWRMEVLIKCQYLSVPLLREIESRFIRNGLLEKDDIFLMLPDEIFELFKSGKTPGDLKQRHSGWGLVLKNGQFNMITGKKLAAFREGFYAILSCKEMAHGILTHDRKTVGGKAENLFTLCKGGVNVPDYFVITGQIFRKLVSDSQLLEKIKSASEDQIIKFFDSIHIPKPVSVAINKAFEELGASTVAVRSSATVEDSPGLSWAGRFDSVVYVNKKNLLASIKRVWASTYSNAAKAYAVRSKTDIYDVNMAIIVQKMIDPELSGVVNTSSSQGVANAMEIEAGYGQCAPIVAGEITPDRYIISKSSPYKMLHERISVQKKMFSNGKWITVNPETQLKRKLPKTIMDSLAEICLKIEGLCGSPQDIEWAILNGVTYIVQTRSQTALAQIEANKPNTERRSLLVTGLRGRVSAVTTGIAKVVLDVKDAAKLKDNEILVTSATTPRWDPLIARSSVIITNEGGSTCHSIRVANELGIPAIVGTGKATEAIRDGETIIVDTTDPFVGKVYKAK